MTYKFYCVTIPAHPFTINFVCYPGRKCRKWREVMKPIARKDDLVIQEMDDEVLVYDLRTNKAICLNQTSALVWQSCDGRKNALEISQDIEKQLGSAVSEDLVWFALNQLEKEKLLNEEKEIVNKFEGLSRREVIKKIGLTSMIALPIVASLVAPSAIHAASCNGVSCNCTGPRAPDGSCTSTTCTAGCTCRETNPAGMNGACLN